MGNTRNLLLRAYCLWAAVCISFLLGFSVYREFVCQRTTVSQRMLCSRKFSACVDTTADVEKCSKEIARYGCDENAAKELYVPPSVPNKIRR